MVMPLIRKLEILADAAKCDVSCASSGAAKRKARQGEIGSTGRAICHAYTPDGRCVSLLKILLTNFCIYDCAYCVSRRSSNVPRARFSVDEVVRLTLDLYRRNCIEGLFLSSGIARGEDDTMADLVRIAKTLRLDHGYRGYIHLKTIPGADPKLIEEAGLYADRLSMNIELPSEASLKTFAPEKSVTTIKKGLAATRARIEQSVDEKSSARRASTGDFRARRSVDADDRRRRRRKRRHDPRRQRLALRVLRIEARLLFRLQPDASPFGATRPRRRRR